MRQIPDRYRVEARYEGDTDNTPPRIWHRDTQEGADALADNIRRQHQAGVNVIDRLTQIGELA